MKKTKQQYKKVSKCDYPQDYQDIEDIWNLISWQGVKKNSFLMN